MGSRSSIGSGGATVAKRLIPDLTPYPPHEYLIVHHPDVQLTADEWIELKDYEKVSSDALCDPGVVGIMRRPDAKVSVPLHVAAAVVDHGRGA